MSAMTARRQRRRLRQLRDSGRHCVVGDHVFIGGYPRHQYTRIGAHAMISGVSGLRGDVIPFGSPRDLRA